MPTLCGGLLAVACGSSTAPRLDAGIPEPDVLDGGTDALAEPASAPAAPDPSWRKVLGERGQYANHVLAVSPQGRVAIGGALWNGLDFGGVKLSGTRQSFVAAFDSDGNHVWSRLVPTSNGYDPGALDVDVRDDGHVAIAARFTSTYRFGAADLVSAGGTDAFSALAGSTGEEVWSRRFGGTADDAATAVALTPDGGVLMAGSFDGTVDFGAGPVTVANDAVAVGTFVVRLDAAGALVWQRDVGALAPVGAMSTSAAGNVALLFYGTGRSGPDFGTGPLRGDTDHALTVATLGSDGAYLWGRRFENPTDAFGDSVSVHVAGSGDVYVVASAAHSWLDFGLPASDVAGGATVAKLDRASGETRWLRRYGSQCGGTARLAFDGDALVLLHCASEGQALERLDPVTGNSLRAWSFTRKDRLRALAIDASGKLFVVGNTDDAAGKDDLFIARYPPMR